ncbi:MAG: ShlB/FhaC/HecB family hemolysin secretion/activation protein [Limnobacter sp.]|uniref:ShlB/FhaC/HecB family hemolysin secretion/activation protein n=1 Tax=Limnobacter sp. TaxID=2003368 RepID=UPI00391CD131
MKQRSNNKRNQTVVAASLLLMVNATMVTPLNANPAPDDANPDNSQSTTREQVQLPSRFKEKTTIRANQQRTQTNLSALRLSVKGFAFENSPLVDSDEINQILSPWRERDLTFAEFELAVHQVADYLRNNGHPNASVQVSRAAFSNGQVVVAVNGLSTGESIQPTVAINEFDIKGLTVATADQVRPILEPYANKNLTVAELQGVAEEVAVFLRGLGYPLAQAYLPPQKIDGGKVQIQVLEGIVDGQKGTDGLIVETAGERVQPTIIETILSKAVIPGQPIKNDDLDRAVRLAGDLAGVRSLTTTLGPGEQPGSTFVTAKVDEENLFTGSVSVDNYGNKYSGEERVNATLNLNSPFGYGELFTLNLTETDRSRSAKIAGVTPVGSSGLKVGASYADLDVSVGGAFTPLNIASNSSVASVFGSYPLIRSATNNVQATVVVDDKDVFNQLLGTPTSDRKVELTTLGLNGNFTETSGAQNSWSVSYGFGDVTLKSNTVLADDLATRGPFEKINAAFGRLTPLSKDRTWNLYTAVSGQTANKNLDVVEQFQLGGPNGVRAYPTGEAIGEEGALLNVELRKLVNRTSFGDLNVYAFYDYGHISQRRQFGRSYGLEGAGVGVSLVKSKFGSVNIAFAKKIGNNPNPNPLGQDADGEAKSARVLIYANIVF